MIRDVHTHNLAAREAIINVEPGFTAWRNDACYSVGIHPWHSSETSPQLIDQLTRDAANPQVVAIGETGFDRLRGASIPVQTELFEVHVRLSEELKKPLIIHCVRAWSELLAERKRLQPKQPWIVHGFRGKPQLERQLTQAGLLLSYRHDINPEAPLQETDDTDLPSTSLPSSPLATQIFLSQSDARTPASKD